MRELGWLSGSWRAEIWGGVFEEAWLPATDNGLVGVGRHVVEGQTRFMEFVSIEPTDAGWRLSLVLGSLTQGPKSPACFDLRRLGEREVVFERDVENDFPKRIIYRARQDGSLYCRLDGTIDGKPHVEEFDFRPVQPEAPGGWLNRS